MKTRTVRTISAAAMLLLSVCCFATDYMQVNDSGQCTQSVDFTGTTFKRTGNGEITGNLTLGGTVDGRDASTDGATLDAHVANTSNPHTVTAAQIGVEAGADVTDAGNVGTAIGGTAEDATPADTDKFAQAGGSTLAHTTWGTIKTLLGAVFAPISKGVTNGDSHDHSGGDGAQIDHTSLANIGTNTHAQIDSHIADTSNPHTVTAAQIGVEAGADVTDAGNVGTAIGGTAEDATPADTDKFAQAGGSTLAHTTWGTIKTLLGAVFAPISKGVTNGDSHDHSGGDGAQIDHVNLANIGTNTHAQIDSHIASTSNPHTVTAAQIGVEAGADITDEANVTSALSGATITSATVAAADKVLVQDADDSDNLKQVTAQSIADLAGAGGGTVQGTDHTYDIRATNEGATAGNARGENSVDLQMNRNAATQVASGTASVLLGGVNNTASGNYSTVVGSVGSTASATGASVVGGTYGLADHFGEQAHSSFYIATAGDNQWSTTQYVGFTTNASETELKLDSSAYYFTVASGVFYRYKAECFGVQNTSAATDGACSDHTGPTYTFTSATGGFTSLEAGRRIYVSDTGSGGHFVVGMYEISSVTNDTTIELTEDPTDGTNDTAGDFNVQGAFGVYLSEGVIGNVGGITQLFNGSTDLTITENPVSLGFVIEADDTNDRIAAKVTGRSSTTMYWNVRLLVQKIEF